MAEKAKKANKPTMIGAHALLVQSIRIIRLNLGIIIKLAILSTIINVAISVLLKDDLANVYQGLWFTFYSCAILWVNRRIVHGNSNINLREALYDGTSPMLKFLLVSFYVMLCTAPFSLGTFIFLNVNRLALGSIFAIIVAGIILLLLSLATIILISRSIFALIVVTLPKIRPMQSLKISWALTKGRSKQIFARLGVVIVYASIIAGVFALLISLTYLSITTALVLLGILINLFITPIFYTYLYQVYRELE